MLKRRRGREGGPAAGRGFGGVPRKPLGRALSCTGTPREGVGGPKKRHLVLYKLAGFCTADTGPSRPFFSLHSSRLTFEKKSKMCKKCTFWPPKPPKMAILALFWPFFAPFSPPNSGGRGTPFWGGPPGRRGGGGAGGAPPE